MLAPRSKMKAIAGGSVTIEFGGVPNAKDVTAAYVRTCKAPFDHVAMSAREERREAAVGGASSGKPRVRGSSAARRSNSSASAGSDVLQQRGERKGTHVTTSITEPTPQRRRRHPR